MFWTEVCVSGKALSHCNEILFFFLNPICLQVHVALNDTVPHPSNHLTILILKDPEAEMSQNSHRHLIFYKYWWTFFFHDSRFYSQGRFCMTAAQKMWKSQICPSVVNYCFCSGQENTPHRMLLYCFEVKFGQKWQGERVQHGGWPRTTNSLWFVQGLQSQSLCLDPLSNVQQIRFLIPFTKMSLYVQYVPTLLF